MNSGLRDPSPGSQLLNLERELASLWLKKGDIWFTVLLLEVALCKG